jgi:serine/threonine protein kinase/tetratricopeptide (TPR) repeat protein
MTAMPAADELDAFVEAFERQYGRGGAADVADYLPPRDHPLYGRVLAELVRVDLEYSWRAGRRRPVDDYLKRFPELQGEGLGEVCFEEYRLRRRAGECPRPEEFRERFGVDTSNWPAAESRRGLGSTAVDPRTAVDPGDAPIELEAVKAAAACGPLEFPEPGVVFLGYELIDELGRGAFGRVYLARESALAGRWVVLKVTLDVRHESRALARLQHTNIVPVYSRVRAESLEAICMPYCGGTSLADVTRALRRAGPAPADGAWLAKLVRAARRVPADGHECTALLDQFESKTYADAVLAIAARLADGLAHAHDRGIIHRDLKPANVLLGDDGEPRLLDFNLADDACGPADVTGLVGGTLPYMAPEQLRAFESADGAFRRADARADVYAFGLMVFELLTGRLPEPVPTGTVADVCRSLTAGRAGPAPSARAANRQVSPAFDAILQKCLEPDPARRYASARGLADDLSRQMNNLPLRSARDRSVMERLRKWGRRRCRDAVPRRELRMAAVLAAAGFALVSARLTENRRALRDEVTAARMTLSAPQVTPAALRRRIASAQGVWDRPTGAAARAERGELAFWLARAERLAARGASPAEREVHARNALRWNDEAGRLAGDGPLGRAIQLQRARVLGDDAATRAALTRPPRGPIDQLVVAVDAMDAGDFAQARTRLEAAVSAEPRSAVAWYALGLCLQNLDRHDAAVGRFETCVALAPGFGPARHLRGSSLLHLGRINDALADLDRAQALEPDDLAVRVDRALARLAANELAGAEADVTAAIDGGYGESHVFFLRARIRQRAGNPAAEADRREGLFRDPRSERDWITRAVARLPGDPKAALADLEQCARLYPASRLALENQAHVLSDYLKRPAEAIAVLDRVVADHPTSALAHSGRGVLRARRGDFDGARADAERALALEDRPLVWYQVAGIYALTAQDRPADRDHAVFLLTKALHHDVGLDLLDADPELASVRRLTEVQKLVAASKRWKSRNLRGG